MIRNIEEYHKQYKFSVNEPEKFWDTSQAINLKSYFFASKAVITGMISLGGGSIINMSFRDNIKVISSIFLKCHLFEKCQQDQYQLLKSLFCFPQ